MSGKEPIKVSLSTFFLIIAIIVIIVMGYFMYQFYNEKVIATKESAELKTQVDNLQGKIDTISQTINSNNSEENDNTSVSNNSASFTDEQVKKAIADYLELDAHAGCGALLEKLTEKGQIKYDSSKYDINTNTGEITTNVKFSDYKKAMLNYVTEAEFEKNWTSKKYFGESANGYLTTMQGGGGLRIYTIKNVSKINDKTFSAKTTAIVENDTSTKENENFTFGVNSYNGKCVISYCD